MIEDDKIGHRTLPQWNAYVEAGRDTRERRARLAAVPAEWRDAVAAHVHLVFQLKQSARKASDRTRG